MALLVSMEMVQSVPTRARGLSMRTHLTAVGVHSGQTTGHSREHARDLSTSGHFPSSSHKISTVTLRHSSHLSAKFNHSASTNVLFPSFTA